MELSIDIADERYEQLERRARTNGFESVEEYCTILITTVLDELEETNQDDSVRTRLEDLGYL